MTPTPNALIVGSEVRHSRRTDVGVIRNVSYPLLPGRPPKYDVRFALNPSAPCWCFADDLTPTALTASVSPALRVVESAAS